MAVLAQDIPQFTALESVKTPRVMRTVFLLILFGFIAAVGFLIYVPWVQTTSGQGVVTTLNPNERQQEINALVSGRIEEFYVRDGSSVKKGDPIARIADIDPQLVERLESERQQVEIQLQAARNALATAEIDERRMAELFREGLAARRDYEQAMIRVEQMRGAVAEAQASLNRTQVSLSRQSSQLVTAPRDGFIQSVNAGDVATIVNAGDPLVTFVPQSAARVVEIFVDGRDVGLVKVGDKARIQFEGWPVVQFSGWPSQAVGTFGGIVTAVDQSAQPDGRFRVLISEDKSDPHPWPKERYARFGASVRAWILLETVPVGYEIWRQLNNFPPELPAGAEPAGSTA
ncbi:MAG: HlyD family efflux transporter periplasmic adaptor subunit [Erythrobacter sp.]|uniref:HlyD family secretion protein n=1 Tax=Erythrobacter sp. TaxID=1042 RepID=UPI0032EDD526